MNASQFVSPVDRIPPSNLEAEMALLGSVLVDREMFETVCDIVQPHDFYASLHESIYLAIFALYERGLPTDKVALAEELRNRGMLDRIGGMAYLNSLMDAVPSAASAEYYARIVRKKAILREMIHTGTRITQLGYESEDDVDSALQRMEQFVSEIAGRGVGVRPFATGLILEQLRQEMLSDDPVKITSSPWRTLNEAIGGFTAGELVAIVASAKIGKTGFAVTLCEFIAQSVGPVPFFATEMGDRGIERRRIALRSGVSARKQRLKLFNPAERSRAARAAFDLQKKPLYVMGRDKRSLRAIWRECRDIRRSYGPLAAICVDHIGFVEEARNFGKGVTETQALDIVYREMLTIADHFECPTFVVIHPNREGSKKRPSRETLQDIRGGGAIENHAHTIICPWREKPEENPQDGEVIVVAARDGGEGPLPFAYSGARAAWMEVSNGEPVPLWFEGEASATQLQLDAPATRDDAEEDVDLAAYARERIGDDVDDINALFGSLSSP